jgi:hypothetical protein
LVLGYATLVLANDIGELGLDFLRLFGCEFAVALRITVRMMRSREKLGGRERESGGQGGMLAEEAARDLGFEF